MARRMVVIAGPPCSGKTTFAEQARSASDVVIDYDTIMQTLTSSGFQEHAHFVALVATDAAIREASSSDRIEVAWILAATRKRQQELARRYPTAEVVVLDPGRQSCEDRARQRKEGHRMNSLAGIARWYGGQP